MSGPLERLTVVDLSGGVAGALTTLLLADNGANVLKVEPLGGDKFRLFPPMVVWNRGKRSITLDIGTPDGKAILLKTLGSADILLESYRPGKTKELGIDYPVLHGKFPSLIYCSLTGYGQEGSNKDRVEYDGLVQAQVGLQWLQEGHRDGPIYLGFQMPSYGAGFVASYGILAALHARTKTGLGQHVDASLLGGSVIMQRWGWSEPVPETVDPPRLAMAMTRRWKCGDDEFLWCHTGARGSFERLMKALDMGEFLSESAGATRIDAVTSPETMAAMVKKATETFASKPRAEWMDILDDADIPNRPVFYPGESFDDEQANVIGAFTTVEDAVHGKLKEVAPPFRFERTPSGEPSPAPQVGEHNREVLLELGYSDNDVDRLQEEGII